MLGTWHLFSLIFTPDIQGRYYFPFVNEGSEAWRNSVICQAGFSISKSPWNTPSPSYEHALQVSDYQQFSKRILTENLVRNANYQPSILTY